MARRNGIHTCRPRLDRAAKLLRRSLGTVRLAEMQFDAGQTIRETIKPCTDNRLGERCYVSADRGLLIAIELELHRLNPLARHRVGGVAGH